MIPEVSEMESNSRMPSLQLLPMEKEEAPEPIEEERQEAEAGSDKTIVGKSKPERMEERDGMWGRRMLESEWGSGYMEKLLELSLFPIHMEITLLKLPESLFTPQLHPQSYNVPINHLVLSVQTMIGQKINTPP